MLKNNDYIENNNYNKKNKKSKKSKIKKVSKEIILDSIFKSLKKNWIWYVSVIISCFILNLDNLNTVSIIKSIGSTIFIIYSGWVIHFISHQINFKSWFKKSKNNVFKHFKITENIINYSCDILDFHDVYHHDSNINKQPKLLFYEFLNNIFSQGILVLISFICFNKIIKNFDYSLCFLWGLAYATIHIFNYNIKNSKVHEDHHLDSNTNYGIDVIDIILGTKKNYNDIEEHNHYAINFIIISFIIYLFNNYFKDNLWFNKIKSFLLD